MNLNYSYILKIKAISHTIRQILHFAALTSLLYIVVQDHAISQQVKKFGHKSMNIIENKILQETLDENGYINIVTVSNVEVLHPGTRGEMSIMAATNQESIYGNLEGNLTLARYSNKSKSPLEKGKKYVVALQDVRMFKPNVWLAGFQEIECDDCSEVIAAYKKAINK